MDDNINQTKLLQFLGKGGKHSKKIEADLNHLSNNYYRLMDIVRQSGMGVQEYKDYLLNLGVDISKFESFFDRFEWDGTGLPEMKNRNYLINSNNEFIDEPFGRYNLSKAGSFFNNKEVIVSADINVYTEGRRVISYFRTSSTRLPPDSPDIYPATEGYNRYSMTIDSDDNRQDAEYIYIYTGSAAEHLDVKNSKLEIGDTPTPYAPAPEDVPTKGLYYNENDNTIIPILPANYKNIINFRAAKEQTLNDNGFFEIDVTEADVLDNDLKPEDLIKDENKYILS